MTELAGRVGASVKAVHQEVDRLVESGLLADRRWGQMRLVRAVTDSVLSRPLTDLLAVTYGPAPVTDRAGPRNSGGCPSTPIAYPIQHRSRRVRGCPRRTTRSADLHRWTWADAGEPDSDH